MTNRRQSGHRLESKFSAVAASTWVALAAIMATGCPSQVADPLERAATHSASSANPAGNGEQPLTQRIDRILEQTAKGRSLSLEVHAAWQILHGALAFQREFQVEHNGRSVSAVDHILGGGQMNGWTVEVVPGSDADLPGLRAMLEQGSKTGQGHADQWLAVLSQCGLKADQTIKVGDDSVTMAGFVKQVQLDCPRNIEQEFSWTLIGLTAYLPTDSQWTANDGKQWSIERLVELEAEQELASSACGGTHRVIGLATALRRHRDANGKITPPWEKAAGTIQLAIAQAKRLQNADGSFSTHYFERAGASPDLAQNLGASGHIVEFLAIAMDDEHVQDPWVRRAVDYLCGVFEKTERVDLECGALYHAAHGLALYRDRLIKLQSSASSAEPAGL